MLAAACSSRQKAVPPVEWNVDPEPTLVLGVEEGTAMLELAGVSDALVLPDGGVLIANSATSELREFSGTGEFARSFGRAGQGPGEFSGSSLFLHLVSPDSLVVFDTGSWRLTTIGTAGAHLASIDAATADLSGFDWYPSVYPSVYLVRNEAQEVRGCLGTPLARVVAARRAWSAALVRVDQLGYLWATALPHEPDLSREWTIFDLTGAPVARATLPAGFEPFSIGGTELLGLLIDSTGVERVAQFTLHRGATPRQTCASPPDLPVARDSSNANALRGGFSLVLVAQEVYYADHGAYASRAEDLRLTGMPDARLVLISADKRYWVGLLIDRRTGVTCGLGVGGGIAGWHEAVQQCG